MSTAVEIPETVILEMQRKVHEFKKELKQKEEALEVVRKSYNETDSSRAYVAKQLREVLDFLQEHNVEAVDHGETWYEELGFIREELLELEKTAHITK